MPSKKTDVLGIIVEISEIRNVQFRAHSEPTIARDITIKDLRYINLLNFQNYLLLKHK
jgi:hypothetical protein